MSRSDSKQFRHLKAPFDSHSKPTVATAARTAYRSKAGDIANMSSENKARSVPFIAKSIDSVLDTSAAAQIVRPLAKLRPSWIGPPRAERSTTPGVEAMKQHIIVDYSSPRLQPPVYIFTSLSDPQWDPTEMQSEKQNNGEYLFSKAFDVEEGEYQYKFRLGPGDWWVCDESKPTVHDGSGNKNNLLVVKLQQAIERKTGPTDQPRTVPKPPTILMPKSDPHQHPVMTPAHEELSAPTPLLKHEFPAPGYNKDMSKDEDGNSSSSSSKDDDDPHERNFSPLLRHESLAPCSVEQEHAPLFRHESIGIGYNHHEKPAATMSLLKISQKATVSPKAAPAGAQSHDPTVEKFPTDHAGIMGKLCLTSTDLAEDESADDMNGLDSPTSQVLSESSMSVPSLPSVREADEEELEKIRELEEREFEKEEAEGEEVDPLRVAAPITPRLTPEEPEDADFEPKLLTEQVEIEERIVIEIVDGRQRWIEMLLEKVGGKGNAM